MGGSPADGDDRTAAPLIRRTITGPARPPTATTQHAGRARSGAGPPGGRTARAGHRGRHPSGASDVVLVDATLGMGGHTLALLSAHPELRVIGIDRDPQALRIAERRLDRSRVWPTGSNWCTPSTTGSAR